MTGHARRSSARRTAGVGACTGMLALAVASALVPSAATYTDTAAAQLGTSTGWWVTPQNVVGLGLSPTTVQVAWQPVTGAASYVVQWSLTEDFTASRDIPAAGTSSLLTGLPADTTVSLRVRDVKSQVWSSVAHARTPAVSLPGPTWRLYSGLSNPLSMALGPDGRVWINELTAGRLDTGTVGGAPLAVVASGLQASVLMQLAITPAGVAYVARFYWSTWEADQLAQSGVFRIDPSGALVRVAQLFSPSGLVASPDGHLYVTGSPVQSTSPGSTLFRIDPATGAKTAIWTTPHGTLSGLSLTPDGQHIVTGSGDGTVWLVDLLDPARTRVLFTSAASQRIDTVVALGDGTFIAAGWASGQVWHLSLDLATGAVATRVIAGGFSAPTALVVSGTTLLLATEGDGSVWRIDGAL